MIFVELVSFYLITNCLPSGFAEKKWAKKYEVNSSKRHTKADIYYSRFSLMILLLLVISYECLRFAIRPLWMAVEKDAL